METEAEAEAAASRSRCCKVKGGGSVVRSGAGNRRGTPLRLSKVDSGVLAVVDSGEDVMRCCSGVGEG